MDESKVFNIWTGEANIQSKAIFYATLKKYVTLLQNVMEMDKNVILKHELMIVTCDKVIKLSNMVHTYSTNLLSIISNYMLYANMYKDISI